MTSRAFDLEVHIDATTISSDVRLSSQSDYGSMDVDLSMFTLYVGTTKGTSLVDQCLSTIVCCTDGSGVVSGSVSSSEVHFVVNYGPVGYEIDSVTGVCEHMVILVLRHAGLCHADH
jgi:hypothetical protein